MTPRRTLALIAILWLAPGFAVGATYYVDSAAAGGGSGTIGSPYNALSSLPALSAGDVVKLKRGSVFRATLTVAASGTSGNEIVFEDYDSGAKPIIKGSAVVGSWSDSGGGLGDTWQASFTPSTGPTVSPVMVFMDGEFLYQGSSATTLNDKEWFWASDVLYVRDDAGTTGPTGTIEATSRGNCITSSSRSYIIYRNLQFSHDKSIATNIAGGGPNFYEGCEWVDYWQAHNNTSSEGATFTGCEFHNCRQTGTTNSNINVSGAGSATYSFRYCFARDVRMRFFRSTAAVTLNIDNCTLIGVDQSTLFNAAASTCTIRNSYIGGGPVGTDVPLLSWTSGTLAATNSYIARGATNGRAAGMVSSGTLTVTDATNIKRSLAPEFTDAARVGVLCFTYDDTEYVLTSRIGNVMRDVLGSTAGIGVTVMPVPGNVTTEWPEFQAMIDAGDDVASHSMWHFDLNTNTNGITGFQYTGGGSAATVDIGGTPLTFTTNVTGAADGVSYDLTNASYDTLGELVAALVATGKYTATRNSAISASAPSNYLANLAATDCKTGAISLANDVSANGRMYTNECVASFEAIENNLFEQDGVTPYSPRAFVYAQGGTNANVITTLKTAGYIGARIAGMGSQRMENLDPWRVGAHTGGAATNTIFRLDNESNVATDTSGSSNTFTNNGTVTRGNGVGVRFRLWAAIFNGTSQYLSKTGTLTNTSTQQMADSWLVAGNAYPTTISGTHTLFLQGDDDDNYHRAWIDSNGAGHYERVAAGVQVVHVFTDNGRFAINTDTDWCVRQQFGTVEFRWGSGGNRYGSTVDATATASLSSYPPNYTGRFNIGAGYDFAGTAAENYFTGRMDDFVFACGHVSNLYAQIEQACATGSIQCWMVHPSDNDHVDIYKSLMDAVAEHPCWGAGNTGNLRVLTFGDALEFARTQGDVTADGLRVRWNQSDASDYTPALGSPLIDAGEDLSYTEDIAGTAVPQGAEPDIGAYEALSAFPPTITSSATFNAAENQTTVGTVTADGDPTPTFSITGGADSALFAIDTDTGALTFVSGRNYESPTDADTDGVYVGIVTATNSEGTDDQTISVTVTDVSEDITTGLVRHWPMDEGASASAFNEEVGNHDATLEGSAASGVTGQINNAGRFPFTGTGRATAATEYTDSDAMSVAFWVKHISIVGAGSDQGVLGYSGDGTRVVFPTTSGADDYYLRNSAGGVGSSSLDDALTSGVWRHVVLTRDGSDLWRCYIDSVLQANTFTFAGTIQINQLGAYQSAVGSDVDLDDVRVYDRQLTDDDVAALFEYDDPQEAKPWLFFPTNQVIQ